MPYDKRRASRAQEFAHTVKSVIMSSYWAFGTVQQAESGIDMLDRIDWIGQGFTMGSRVQDSKYENPPNFTLRDTPFAGGQTELRRFLMDDSGPEYFFSGFGNVRDGGIPKLTSWFIVDLAKWRKQERTERRGIVRTVGDGTRFQRFDLDDYDDIAVVRYPHKNIRQVIQHSLL